VINGMHTLNDFNLKGKIILARFDMNSPLDPKTREPIDITRIEKSLPTLKELSEKGAKTVILIHQGSDIEYHNYASTRPHAKIISQLLGEPVDYIDDVCGPAARDKIKALKNGQFLMLENVRFMAEEMTLFETKLNLSAEEQAKTQVVQKLATLADFYLCDAFAAAHRCQPTLVGMEEVLPSVMGRLFEKEIISLNQLLGNSPKPCIFIPSEDLIKKKNLEEYIEKSKDILNKFNNKIELPVDFAYSLSGGRKEVKVSNLPIDYVLTDLGKNTISEYETIIKDAKTVFFNGPVGVFEKKETELGTRSILTTIAKSNAFSAIGGGDSITAVNKYNLANDISYISTGGGALVRFLSGEELPVVKALRKSAKRFDVDQN